MLESDADDPESEEDEVVNPYPIEGVYKDEDDRVRYDTLLFRLRIVYSCCDISRCRIMQMPEIEREGVLAQRAEEKRKFEESFKLNQLVQQQTNGEHVASAAKSLWILSQRRATLTCP